MKLQKIFILLALFATGCSTQDDITSPSYTTMLNISYGSNAVQKMDLYLPPNRSAASTKLMIMIHGGGWTSGDKSDFTVLVDTLKKRLPDYAIANINYRLSASPNNLFPTQELDVKAAVEYLYNKSAEYQISNKFVFLGASAGAHLAMLQAYKYNLPVTAKAVVSFFGPGDLLDMYNNPVGGNPLFSLVLAGAVGATPAQDPAIYFSSSPVNFISTSTAMPTILLHGGADPLVSASQSLAVQNKLIAAGIPNQYVLYPTGGHGDWDVSTYTDAFNKIQLFLENHVQ